MQYYRIFFRIVSGIQSCFSILFRQSWGWSSLSLMSDMWGQIWILFRSEKRIVIGSFTRAQGKAAPRLVVTFTLRLASLCLMRSDSWGQILILFRTKKRIIKGSSIRAYGPAAPRLVVTFTVRLASL